MTKKIEFLCYFIASWNSLIMANLRNDPVWFWTWIVLTVANLIAASYILLSSQDL